MADGRFVKVSVSDEGPGVPAELRERVFEKFFRIPGHESRDPRRRGIGLGLPRAGSSKRRGAGSRSRRRNREEAPPSP